MKAILRTYTDKDGDFFDKIVEIDESHDFLNGPYADTVPFAVGSNQTILSLND